MNNYITISDVKIGRDFPPYIIAEMSANHGGSIEKAFDIIQKAKLSGANAVKIQTYKPDTITLKSKKPDFMINSGLWKGQSLYELYEKAHTPWSWHKDLFAYAEDIGITLFSSPFDLSAVDLLEDLNAPAYKIASFEVIDLPLIRYVASTGKPLIISTGMANFDEINEAIETANSAGCSQIAILHCVSGYPAPSHEYNLSIIPDMISKFDLVTGLSDHTLDNLTAICSIGLGASIVEKHFTLNRNGGGADDSFSLEPSQLLQLCEDTKQAWLSLGKIDYNLKECEKDNVKFRRSLYFIENLKKGQVLNEKSIKSVRPGYGISPKYFDELIGRKLQKDINSNSPVTWDAFNE